MSEWVKWVIRATTKDGKKFTIDYPESVAVLVFKNMYDAAIGGILPTHEQLPNTWKTEVFLQFTNPDGIVAKIDLCQNVFKDDILVLNSMWFETDRENRIQLKTEHPISLVYTFADAVKQLDSELHALQIHEMYHQVFRQGEMSQDFHMGYFDDAGDQRHRKLEGEYSIKVAKSRAPDDNSGAFEFHPYVEKEKEFSIQVGKKNSELSVKGDIHNHSDFYSAPAWIRTKYRIYINGKPSTMILNDIDFLEQIHENVTGGLTSVNDVHGAMDIQQNLYELIERFLRVRDFKIGAHPADGNEVLEDGNDADYSLFWGHQEKETIYITPLTAIRTED